MDHLNEKVKEGDLILLHTRKKRRMLAVISAPDDENPRATAVIVKRVYFSFDEEPGTWILDGPKVRDTMDTGDRGKENAESNSEDDNSETEEESGCEKEDEPEVSFRTAIESLDWGIEPTVTVNPGGRDVLEHYFGWNCPECGGDGHTCPGCRPFCFRYPDLSGECAVDQACPICLGYDVAEDDSGYLNEIDDMEQRIRYWKGKGESVDYYQERGLECIRERYTMINARREEMGMPLYDVEREEREWRELYCTD